jgi:hypothetical protein
LLIADLGEEILAKSLLINLEVYEVLAPFEVVFLLTQYAFLATVLAALQTFSHMLIHLIDL